MTESNVVNLTAANPFDPAALRLDQSFAGGRAVKKLLTTIPVRKPGNQDFVRVHAGEDYRLDTAVISLKDDRETYLLAPTVRAELIAECVPVSLYTVMNRQGVLSLWPVRLPAHDGKDMEWWRSAREAAALAMDAWVRIKANPPSGTFTSKRWITPSLSVCVGWGRCSTVYRSNRYGPPISSLSPIPASAHSCLSCSEGIAQRSKDQIVGGSIRTAPAILNWLRIFVCCLLRLGGAWVFPGA
jgi:hypothetical protein